MRKTTILTLLLVLFLLQACKTDDADRAYMEKVLNNLEQIESATYFSIRSGFAPFDTTAYSVYKNYIKEYKNPSDTFVGASFVILNETDSSKMDYCYDGDRRARVHWDEKTMEIDHFKDSALPFRVVNAPFFARAISLLQYTMETMDSITIDTKDFGDSIQYTITVYDTVVEFCFSEISYTPALHGTHKGDVSKYDIWINKSNDLPYRVVRDMPHDKTIEVVSNIEFNNDKLEDFIASDYFPDFPLRSEKKRAKKVNLLGKLAPDWVLYDTDSSIVALDGLKSKVLMIQFTSVSCGPCKMAISFLKELENEYSKDDFDFVAIEGFNRNSRVLEKYQERNSFKYKFLMSTDEVTQNYQIKAIPVFYLLDENRIIREIIRGYGKGTTDKEIRYAISELI
ncbi:MAG: redoxin family protein [Bacteroidales bacterium]|nr:redoxin family protein [Bacteroidales bacterium]